MKTSTLLFPLRGREILLAQKKRRTNAGNWSEFGVGKWNGVGGRVESGESPETGVIREAFEEIGIVVQSIDLTKVAVIDFNYTHDTSFSQRCHVFTTKHWENEPSESDEMAAPQWFSFDELPFKEMWDDDPIWLPRVLAGETVWCTVEFGADGETMNSYTIRPLSEFA